MATSSVQKRRIKRQKAIYNKIKENNCALSRNDLCKLTKLSITAVAESIDQMIRAGLITEQESSESRIGRRPTLLAINTDAQYFAGIECSSYALSYVVIDALERPVYQKSIHLNHPTSQEVLIKTKDLILGFKADHPDKWDRLVNISIALPGKLDAESGTGLDYVSIPDWDHVDFRGYLSQYVDRPLRFMHNVDSMLLGYMADRHIPATGTTAFIMIRNGTGIRIYAKGTLLSDFGVLCELGHDKAENANRMCFCGRRGCYDSEITTQAIINKIKEFVSLHGASKLSELMDASDEHAIIARFCELVRDGDRDATLILKDCSGYIAQLIGKLLLICTPDTIVLSSEFCHALPHFEDSIKEELRPYSGDVPPIDFVLPDHDYGAIGSALSGYQHHLNI